jgi:hypothetical protein
MNDIDKPGELATYRNASRNAETSLPRRPTTTRSAPSQSAIIRSSSPNAGATISLD